MGGILPCMQEGREQSCFMRMSWKVPKIPPPSNVSQTPLPLCLKISTVVPFVRSTGSRRLKLNCVHVFWHREPISTHYYNDTDTNNYE